MKVVVKKNNIDKYLKISRFLQKIKCKNTKTTYKSHINNFFTFIGENPDKYICDDFRLLDTREKIALQNKYEEDIERYWSHLIDHNVPPMSINNALGTIKVLLNNYRIRLDVSFWRELKRRGTGNHAVTEEIPLTKEIINKILQQGDVKAKALFLLLSSSGMRIGEALALTLDDIEFDFHGVTKVNIRLRKNRMTKSKSNRVTFISDEATRYLKIWLDCRKDYLKKACGKVNNISGEQVLGTGQKYKKSINDTRIFPFSDTNAREIWNNLIRKAGYNEKDEWTNRRKAHVHGLRKFFRSNFHNTDLAEELMGHEGYLSTYRNRDDISKAIAYQKEMPSITIFDYEIKNSVQEQRIKELEEKLEKLKRERLDLREKVLEEQIKNEQLRNPEFTI